MNLKILKDRDYREKDNTIRLRKIVFPSQDIEKQSSLYWDWEFKENVYGKAETFIAKFNDDLIGHYALLPQEYIINGNVSKGRLAVDAMVHPNYRRQGVFTSLQEFSLNNTTVNFTIGYSLRKEVLSAELKGGYRIVKRIPIFIFPVNFKEILKNYIHISGVNKIIDYMLNIIYRLLFSRRIKNNNFIIKEVKELGCAIKDFFEYQENYHDIFLRKTAKYLTWRFDNIPFTNYAKFIVTDRDKDELLAYFILREKEISGFNFINVVDLEMKKRRYVLLDSILRFIILRARENLYTGVAYMLLDDGYISKRLKYYGILKSQYKFNLIVYDCENKGIFELFRKSKRIHLNWSSTDLM